MFTRQDILYLILEVVAISFLSQRFSRLKNLQKKSPATKYKYSDYRITDNENIAAVESTQIGIIKRNISY